MAYRLALTRRTVGVEVDCGQYGHVNVGDREGHELTAVAHSESFTAPLGDNPDFSATRPINARVIL
jgi:hypothetical protein